MSNNWAWKDKHAPPKKPKLVSVTTKKEPNKKYRIEKKREEGGDNFYLSKEWLSLRYKVLKAYGHSCMLCNRHRKHGVVMHVDHIKPRSRFPHLALEFSNMQVLCDECNVGKGASDTTDWRPGHNPVDIADDLDAELLGSISHLL